jgi:hypothetical protein
VMRERRSSGARSARRGALRVLRRDGTDQL